MEFIIDKLDLNGNVKNIRKFLDDVELNWGNCPESLEKELIQILTSHWDIRPEEVKKLLYPEDYYAGIIEATTKSNCLFPDRAYEIREKLSEILNETKIADFKAGEYKGIFGFEKPLSEIGFEQYNFKVIDKFQEIQEYISKNDAYFLIVNVKEKWWRLYDYHTQHGLNNKYIGYTVFDDEGHAVEIKE